MADVEEPIVDEEVVVEEEEEEEYEEEEFAAVAGANEVKLFGKWTFDVEVRDISLVVGVVWFGRVVCPSVRESRFHGGHSAPMD
jgi:hypothetical protein